MKNIIFVCHGSICRSPAAEFIAKDFVKKNKLEDKYEIWSRAISTEEIGNDIYPPMKVALRNEDIPFEHHEATLINNFDFQNADLIFYMDDENLYCLERYFGKSKKFKPIFEYTKNITEIEDPWYTDRFELVVKNIKTCIENIFKNI